MLNHLTELNRLTDLEEFLRPQERLDRLIAATFRRFGPKVVDLSYANPAEGPSEAVREVLVRAAAERRGQSLQYPPGGGRAVTRRAIAGQLRCQFDAPLDFHDVIMTPGATAALNVIVRGLFGPDDEVIVLTPCWQDYPLYLRNLRVPFRSVALAPDKHLDLDAIGRAIGSKTRAVLFSHPCCPTGVVYSEEEIIGLCALLERAQSQFRTRIYVISDEVHRDLVWSGRSFLSPLQVYPRTLVVYSFGKALKLQGQRIGYVALSPRMPENMALRTTLERGLRLMGFGGPTSLMQYAVCDLLDYQPDVVELAGRQARVRRALTGYGYHIVDSDASFYVYAESPIDDDFAFAELLAAEGVLVVPSSLFHEPGYIRLSLTARFEGILAGLSAFGRAMARLEPDTASAGISLGAALRS
jgi:aspartate aminotransferase